MTFPGRLRSAALAALFLATLTLPALAAVTPKRSPAMTALRLPLRFEQNQGQTAAPVRYLARGRGYTLFLTPSETVLSLRPGRKASSTSDVIRMRLVKGSQTPHMEALDALPGESNYLIGRNPKDWRRGVPGYGRVAERGVYPGIDLIYYGNQQQLEYDFVVTPNADPSRIALQMEGASHVTIDRDGNMVLSNHDGSVTLRRPTIYQMDGGDRVPVNGRFVRKGKNKVAFSLGAYDHSRQLVIDPVLEYSSYLGGSGNEIGEGIAVDSQGYIYVAGGTGSMDFPVKGGVQSSCGGSCKPSMSGYADAFITKIDSKGPSLVYSTYLGGSSPDQANGIAVDADGNAYVAGVTYSSDFPLQNALQTTCGPCATVGSNAFIAELNPAGSGLIFSTYLGSSTTSFAQAIALDGSNDIFVAGSPGSAFPVTTGAFGTNCGGNGAFVSKLQPGGSALDYSGCIGTSPTWLSGLAVDSKGAAYIVGQTQPSSYTTTPGAFQTVGNNGAGSTGGFFDGFVTKIDPTGTKLDYSTFLGGTEDDRISGIAVDASGDAYVTGYTTSPDFPVRSALQPKCGGCSQNAYANAFVTELNSTGSGVVFSTYLGGSGGDGGAQIALDSSGNIFLTGYANSGDFPFLNAYQQASQYGNHLFVAVLSPGGASIRYATPFGGGVYGGASSIAVDASDAVYLTGQAGGGWPVTQNAVQSTIGSWNYYDAFVTILGDSILQSSPSSVSFSDQALGTSSSAQTMTLTVSGHAPVTLSSISATGDFSETDDCPSSFSAGQSCSVQVIFKPTAAGARTGTLSISSNTSQTAQTIALTGNGVAPTATITPSTLTFAAQPVFMGTVSAAQTVILHNSGAGPMAISAVSASGDFSETNTCGSSLAAGADCTISVTFSPTATGTRTGALNVTDNASNSPQSVALTGTGVSAIAGLSPSSLTFALQRTATTSAAQTITLANSASATAALQVSKVTVSGDYAETNNCGTLLAIGASCSIQVTFTPTATGTRTGTLMVFDNSGAGQQSVMLSGTGAAPSVVLPTTSVKFNSQLVGTASGARGVLLQNTGNAPLGVEGITTTGDFSATNTCGSTVAAGSSCTIAVTFKPTATGSRSGTLTVTDDAPDSPQSVPLSGMGVTPVVSLSPMSLSYADQLVGTVSTTQTVKLTNTGTYTLTISGYGYPGDYKVSNTCGMYVQPGSSCTFSLAFAPTAAGTRNGVLTLTDNAADSPQQVTLTGKGTAPAPVLSPTSLIFSDQRPGTTSAAQTITLTNAATATAPLALSGIAVTGAYAETNNCGTSLAIGASCGIQVTFTPEALGTLNGTVVITDNSGTGQQSVSLTGKGTAPIASLSTGTLLFDPQLLGTASSAQIVTLTNTGNTALNIKAVATTGDYSSTNTCGSSVAAGASCQMSVIFKPTATGERDGTLTVNDDASGSPQMIEIRGTAVAPAVTLTPASFAFSSQRVGSNSAPQFVFISNSGTAPLHISGLATSGDFLQTNSCGTGLGVGETCTISVTFSPTAAGTRSGAITLTDDSPDSPQTLSLSGVGTAPGAVLAPASLDFGSQSVWTAGSAQTVALSNNGTAPLTVTSIDAGGDFLETNNCPGSLAAGAVCTISVAFRPVSAGADKEVLTVYDDAGSSPQQVALAGTGTAPVTTISVPALTFGSQTVGSASPAQTIALSNTGTDVLQIAGIGASGDFTESNTCSAQLAAGAQCSISVQFAPAAAGDRTGSLVINDSTGGATIALDGTGTQPGAVLTPSVLAFGSAAVGTASPAQTVTLTNSGSAPLAISGITASTDFQQTSTCGSSLDAGASCIINVQFAPSAAGARTGTVTVADGLGTQVVAVSGIGNSPEISLDPATLTFGSYRKGSTSPAQTVTLTNSGSAPLVITGVAAEGDFSATNDCGATLAAGAHCSLNVFFTPTARGQRTGALLIETASETAVVTLSGSGSYTGVRLSPAEVHFGSQPVGTVSPAQTVTVTNTGTGVLTIRAITASGDYQQTNTCGTLPAQVPAGGVCSLSITVTPTTPGRITGSIQLATSAGTVQVGAAHRARAAAASDSADVGSETDVIALSAAGGSSDLTVSPSSLAFGSQTVGTASAAQAVTVTNQGSGALTLNPLQISGNFAEKDTCTGTLAAGATCSVEVTMTPTAAGAQTGLLTVSAGSSTAAVALSGSGAAPGLFVSPSMLTFDKQQVGTASAAQTVTLTNQGSTDLTLTLQTGSDFPLGSSCPTLAAGATCQIPVTFKPTAAGSRTGVLAVTADGGQSVEAALSGTGTAPAVTLSAATLDFSHQPVGIASAAQTVTVTNSGTAPLTISSVTANGDFAAASQCGASLDAGASCTVQVRFKPAQAGSRTGTLQISDDAAGSPSTVALSGSGSDFTLTTPQTASLSAGQSAQFALILQNQGAGAENLTLSCSGAPAGGTCQVSPGTVALNSDPATVTVSVTTAGRALALPVPSAPPAGTQRWWGLGLLGAILLLFGWRWRPQTRQRRLPVTAALAGLALLVLLAGCGGGPSPSGSGGTGGTPSGTYTLTLKATAASGLSHTVSWKVNVE